MNTLYIKVNLIKLGKYWVGEHGHSVAPFYATTFAEIVALAYQDVCKFRDEMAILEEQKLSVREVEVTGNFQRFGNHHVELSYSIESGV